MMERIEKIRVRLKFSEEHQYDVGEIVKHQRSLYFKYKSDFLDTGLNVSPFKLSPTKEIIDMSAFPFDGLAGVFNDSLPDGWGRLLLDRRLASKGISLSQVSLLDRLAYIGDTGIGALSYFPERGDLRSDHIQVMLDELSKETEEVLKGTATELLDELFIMGGSSGGARPKVNVLFNEDTGELLHGHIQHREGFYPWIIKFASSMDMPDIANVEYAYYLMAIEAGIEMSPCQLFYGASGRAYFGTKRFDRKGKERFHMHSASGIMHDNFRLSNMDYGHLMDCAFQLERDTEAYAKVLRLAAFNIFGHNRDDHSKNFAFLMDRNGGWKLAPAYDLTFSSSSHGFHSTMVAGESQHPSTQHLMELAQHFGVENANLILEEVRGCIANWKTYAQEAGVSIASTNRIQKVLEGLI